MEDSFSHRGKRRQLVEYLRMHVGIKDEAVLSAMNTVPRHFFLESVFSDFAYEDRAFPILAHQTISHPSTVAEQSELLGIQKGDKVLEIGTGCGYQTAVLLHMGAEVYTIERQKELFDFSGKMFQTMKIFPHSRTFGDGFSGLSHFAPFDKILVTCGAEILPTQLLKQLKVGGIMVIPIGSTHEHLLHRFTKISDVEFEKETFGTYSFVPMLGNVEG